MKTTFISSQVITNATRMSLAKLQIELVTAQKEVASGRHADVGSVLGLRTGYGVSLRAEQASLTVISQTNGLAATELDITQSALQGISDAAQSFVSSLLAIRGANSGSAPQLARTAAEGALQSLTGALNSSINGTFVFGGINSGQRPVRDYFVEPPEANRRGVNEAFLAAFAITQSDPAIAAIDAADLQAFLDTGFADLFEPPAWKSAWSRAADDNRRIRIGPNEVIDGSVNANELAFRKLARAYTMVAALGADGLNEGAFQAVLDTAVTMAGEAIADVSALQGVAGSAQERVAASNDRMSIKISIVTGQINDLEAVDPFEAATRLTSLLTQIEIAYAVTARIQRMSLLEYL